MEFNRWWTNLTKRIGYLAIFVLVIVLAWGNVAYAWWNSSWGQRVKLTFDNSDQSEALQHFPVLVVLDSSRIDYSKVQDDYDDLRFIDSDDETVLDYEVEEWNESGTSYVWVEVPQITGSSSTDYIWMYYGNSTTSTAGEDIEGTWDSDGNFVMVQHMHQTSYTALDDSTNNNNDVTGEGGNPTYQQTGKVATAVDFDGTGDYVSVPDSSSLDITDHLTIEMWAYVENNYNYLLTKQEDRYASAGNNQWSYAITFWDANYNSLVLAPSADGDNTENLGDSTITASSWTYIVFTFDRPTATPYINGSAGSTENWDNDIFSGSGRLMFGARWDASESIAKFFFQGNLDEVRISNTPRSADWIAAQHKSMTDDFITFSPHLVLSTTSTTIQIDVPHRYRAVIYTEDASASDYLIDFYDRAQNDSNPVRILRLSPTVQYDNNWTSYRLSRDTGRITTILESSSTRVKVRVEGVYKNDSGTTLTDGTNSITSVIDYTFISEGVFYSHETDFRDGLTLDANDTFNGILIWFNTDVDTAHSETIIGGDGATEDTRSTDGEGLGAADGYVVIQGADSYQDVIFGQINLNGNIVFSNGSNAGDWYNVDVGGEDDAYGHFEEASMTLSGTGTAQYFIQFHAQADLADPEQRKDLFKDLTHPDVLSFTTGKPVDEADEMGEVVFSCGFEGADSDLSDGGDGWDGGACGGSSTFVGNSTTQVHSGTYSAKATYDAEQGTHVYEENLSMPTAYTRFYFYLDTETLSGADEDLLLLEYYDSSWTTLSKLTVTQDASGNLELNAVDANSNYYGAGSDGYLNTDTWYAIEFKTYAHASSGTMDIWLDGTNVLTLSGKNTGSNNVGVVDFGGWSFTAGNIAYFDDVVVSTSYIGPANWNVTEGAYTMEMNGSSQQLTVDMDVGNTFDASDMLFSDGFESGDAGAWTDGESGDTGDIYQDTEDPQGGSYSLRAVYQDTDYERVQHELSSAYTDCYIRFYFKLKSGWSMGNSDTFALLFSWKQDYWNESPLHIFLAESSSTYRLFLMVMDDSETQTYIPNYRGSSATEVEVGQWYSVEVHWKAATGAGQNDGGAELFIDGVSKASDFTIDNDTWNFYFFTLGNSGGLDATTSGTTYFDDVVIDDAYIGPGYRHKPSFKIRNYRSTSDAVAVTYDDSVITDGTDYNADIMPFSRAYFADELLWHSTFEDVASVNTPDVGDNGSVSGVSFSNAKYGKGADFDNDSDYINITTTNNIDFAKGTIEYWYQPGYNFDDSNTYVLFCGEGSTDDYFSMEKNSDNNLYFYINRSGGAYYGLYTDGVDLWDSGDWVHIRAVWDDSQSTDEFQLFVNGVEPAHVHANDGSYDASLCDFGTTFCVNNWDGEYAYANGVIDEFRIYTFTPGGAAAPKALANGGDTGDTDEYLNDSDDDYTLDFVADDSSGRGEYVYLGAASKFTGVNIDLATLGVEDGEDPVDFDWEYWKGAPGNGLSFNASDDDVNCGNNSSLDLADNMTIEAWIYPTGWGEGGYGTIVARQSGGSDGYQFEISSGAGAGNSLFLYADGKYAYANNNAVTLDTWQHVAVSISSDVATFYINGVDVTDTSSFDLSTEGTQNFYVGSWDGADDTFGGVIDEVRVWSDARTQAEIQDNMHKRINPSSSGLVGYWRLDENVGTTAYDETGTNNGNISGADWTTGCGALAGWQELVVTDTDTGAASFKADGNFYFTEPTDWAKYSVNGSPDLYFIRGHLESGSYTQNPIEDTVRTDILTFQYLNNLTTTSTFDFTSPTANTAPTALSSDLSGLAHPLPNKALNISAKYSDSNGASDLDKLYLLIDHDSGTDIEYYAAEGADASGQAPTPVTGSSYISSISYDRDTGNPTANDITITWHITLNWDWDDSDNVEFAVKAIDDSAVASSYSSTDGNYVYDDELTFTGTLAASGSVQGGLDDGDWVQGSETISWSGLTVIYQGTTTSPADSDFDIQIIDDDDGSWTQTTTTDAALELDTTADAATDTSDIHQINIINISEGGSDASSETWTVKVDATAPSGVGAPTFGTIQTDSIVINKPSTVTENESGLYQWQARRDSSTTLGWQAVATTTDTDTGLTPNTQYTYDVQFSDSVGNEGGFGTTAQKYTLAALPTAGAFTNITATSIQANWGANSNPAGTEYYCEYDTGTTFVAAEGNSGWITDTSWNKTGLTEGNYYSFQVMARNGENQETDWVELGYAKASTGLQVSTTATTITIDVPNRYRAVMTTNDTDDYLVFSDRAQNDSSPNAAHEFKGPCILETNTYCLRDDANRKTTILESNGNRVKVRVEGKFNNEAGTDYLDDDGGDDDLTISVDYTFTTEGVFVSSATDFKDGLTLDSDSGHNGYEWLGLWSDVTDGAFDDTGNIIYGDGNTEGTSSTDGAEFEDTNKYVVFPGTGSGTYQDAFIGIMRAGWYDESGSGSVDEWHWDENNDSTTQDQISAQEQNIQTSGVHYAKWFFLMLAENDLDTEAEREAYINDYRNPDILTCTTGSEWNEMSTGTGQGAANAAAPAAASPGVKLDGVNDNIRIANATAFDFGTSTSFTVEAWVKLASAEGADQIIFEAFTEVDGEFVLFYDLSYFALRADIWDDTTSCEIYGSTDVADDKWHHVAAVFNRNASCTTDDLLIYVDGIQESATVRGSTANMNGPNIDVGGARWGNSGTESINGNLDEGRVWNDARTATEIRDNMFKQIDSTSGNLHGYWRLNENTGTTAYDETGNDLDGILTNGPVWRTGFVPDHYNEAEWAYTVDMVSPSPGLEFDGGDDLIAIGDSSTLEPSNDITVETWVKLDQLPSSKGGEMNLVVKRHDSSPYVSYLLNLMNTDDSIQFSWVNTSGTTYTATAGANSIPGIGIWFHAAGIKSGSNLYVYLNGVDVTSTADTPTGTILNSDNNLSIGAYSEGGGDQQEVDGVIDEVRIWSDARTAAEIQQNMFKQVAGSSANLVGYWRLNENTGTTAHDQSPNHNNGTISGATWTAGIVPEHIDQVELDINGGSNVSTLINDASGVSAGDTSITVDSTTGFPDGGGTTTYYAYIEGDKFSYTDATSTTFTGIPSTGENSVIGHADNSVVSLMNRHKPMYKIRKYRYNTEPSLVTLENNKLIDDTHYSLDYKPVSDAYFADELSWHSTLESETAAESPDVGTGDSLGSNNVTYTVGKYGNGAEFDGSGSGYLYFPVSGNIDLSGDSAGVIEFWMQPDWASSTTTTTRVMTGDTAGGLGVDWFCFFFAGSDVYSGDDIGALFFEAAIMSTVQSSVRITNANFSWAVDEWVHVRIEWDDTLSTDDMQIYINGSEPTHTHSNEGNLDVSALALDSEWYIGTEYQGATPFDGIIDEFRVYTFTPGGAAAPKALAAGGNTSDTDEYLFDEDNDYTLDFDPVDASSRGKHLFIGTDSMFSGINVDLATNGATSGTLNLDWEYWDGDEWADLEGFGFIDGTSNLTQDGAIYWNVNPTNWRPYSVNGSTDLYYIRCSLNASSGTYTADPIENFIKTDILTLQYLDNLSSEDQGFFIGTVQMDQYMRHGKGVTAGGEKPLSW